MSAEALRRATDKAQSQWAEAVGRVAVRYALELAGAEDPESVTAVLQRMLARETANAAAHGVNHAQGILRAAGLTPGDPSRIPTAPPVALERTIRESWALARQAHDPQSFRRAIARRIIDAALTDAWRDGTRAAIAADPSVIGWRRVARDGCCGACLVLADGTIHPLDVPLDPHPFCRCFDEPVVRGVNEHESGRPTPLERWEAMTADEQDRMFLGHGGKTKANLLRDGLVDLEELVTRVPRAGRALVRETSLRELVEPTVGRPFPSAARAVVPLRKLTAYALNVDHEDGGPKARVFASALGIRVEDAEYLAQQLVAGLQQAPVGKPKENAYAKTWPVDMDVLGLNGRSARLRTAWKLVSDKPTLVSVWVDTKRPRV